MTYIPGPVEVANTVKAKNGLDFPVVEDTDIWGGFQVVATIAERNAIPSVKLKVGMRAVVQADGLTYKLTVLSPATWVVDTGAGGGVTDGDKGDVTVSASGATWTIDNTVVTNAKLANVATATFKGRTTAGTGSPEDLTGTQATTLLDTFTSTLKGLAPASGGGTANYLRADGTWALPVADGDKGDITVSASGATWTIDNTVVTNAKLADVATATFKGRTTAGTGSPEDLTATQATALLNNFSSTLKGLAPASGGGTANFLRADGTWALPVTDGDKGDITVSASGATWTIDNAVVTNAKLANVATATFKGRTTAGTGSPEDLTGTQATALLDTFTSSLKGLAPASGGGTANYLRADGTWIIPPALKTPISTKTANYLITTADGTIIVNAASGAVTITLPSAASAAEYHFTIKKIDTSSNTVTIAGTIDGTTNYVLYSQYEAVRVQSDGSVYWII